MSGRLGGSAVAFEGVRGRLRSASLNPSVCTARGVVELGGLIRRQEAVQRQRGSRGRSLLWAEESAIGVRDLVLALYVYVAPLSWSGDPRALTGARGTVGTGAEKLKLPLECACK